MPFGTPEYEPTGQYYVVVGGLNDISLEVKISSFPYPGGPVVCDEVFQTLIDLFAASEDFTVQSGYKTFEGSAILTPTE